MTTTPTIGLGPSVSETPIAIKPAQTRADRIFLLTLLLASVIVLLAIGAILAFLIEYSVPAVHYAGLQLHHQPALGPIGISPIRSLGVLVGTVMIAVLALFVAVPVSISAALLINEYAPRWCRRALTARGPPGRASEPPVRDLGAQGPRVRGLQHHGVVGHHASFIPVFREPDAHLRQLDLRVRHRRGDHDHPDRDVGQPGGDVPGSARRL